MKRYAEKACLKARRSKANGPRYGEDASNSTFSYFFTKVNLMDSRGGAKNQASRSTTSPALLCVFILSHQEG
jgi:hypothetical protein